MTGDKKIYYHFKNEFVTSDNQKFTEQLKDVWEQGIAQAILERISKGQV